MNYKSISFIISTLFFIPGAQAQVLITKCKAVEGVSRCEKVLIKSPTGYPEPPDGSIRNSHNNPVEALKRLEKSKKIESLNQEISLIEDEIDDENEEFEKTLDSIRNEKYRARNNLAGAVFNDSISSEVSSELERHKFRIEQKREKIRRLEREREIAERE